MIKIMILSLALFHMKRLGLGDLGAGRRMDASEKNRRPSGFPNNKAKTALKLPWLRNAQLLRSQTELFAT
jgi:hypothetical protein